MRVLLTPLVLLLGACVSPAHRGPSEPIDASDRAPLIDVAPQEPLVVRPWAEHDGAPDRFLPNAPVDRFERVSRDPEFAPLPGPVAPRRR